MLANENNAEANNSSNFGQFDSDGFTVQSNNDEFVLSEATEKAMANAEFDAAKVARIKEAIEQGNYPIDAKKVAESFASLERMIGGS